MNESCAPYPALAVANYFLNKSNRITPMKLQKLIYFAHGWYLAIMDEPLINETIQAWDYGPVISSVYYEFRDFGGNFINELASEVKYNNKQIVLFNPTIDKDDIITQNILDAVWETFGGYTAIQLSNITHEHDSPWYTIRKKGGIDTRKVEIPDKLIKEYFEKSFENNG